MPYKYSSTADCHTSGPQRPHREHSVSSVLGEACKSTHVIYSFICLLFYPCTQNCTHTHHTQTTLLFLRHRDDTYPQGILIELWESVFTFFVYVAVTHIISVSEKTDIKHQRCCCSRTLRFQSA